MVRLNKLSTTQSFDEMKEWCNTINEYFLVIDPSPGGSLMVNMFRELISEIDKEKNIRKMRGLYKEMNVMIEEMQLPDSQMDALNKLLQEKFGHNIADEVDREMTQIEKIIKRGKIRNDREFELVKRREDMVYADDSQLEYTLTLQKLMSDYEQM